MEEDADSEPLVRPVPVSSRDEVPIVPVLAAVNTLIKLCKVSWLHAFIPNYCKLVLSMKLQNVTDKPRYSFQLSYMK